MQQAYDHFNATLFDGKLTDVFITYQRRAHSAGYFSPDRFSSRTEQSAQHELALNPDGFIGRTDQQIVQTLVHEMVHVWQQALGTPPGRGYHNREWAAKMKAIGLQPSSTGMVGGKETGQQRNFKHLAAKGFLVASELRSALDKLTPDDRARWQDEIKRIEAALLKITQGWR